MTSPFEATTAGRSYVEGRFAPVGEERTDVALEVSGSLPADLNGRYVRIGPNPIHPDAAAHYFTGDGMVHGIRLEDGRADWYRNRWVRTPDVAVALGEEERSLPRGRENDRGAVNTNVVRIGGRTLALVEAGSCPVELTDELGTEGSTDLGGTLAGSFSAHPKLDPSTGRWHAITYHWTEAAVHHVVVGLDGEVERDVVVATQGSPMVHDTAITETNILLFDLPVRFDRDEAVGGVEFPYHWYPEHAARVGVLPLDGEAADVRWCEVPQAFVFHTVNAVDLDGGRVAVDVVRWERAFDRDRRGPSEGPTRLERWTLDPATGTSSCEVLDDRSLEFPRIDERLVGRSARFVYAPGMMGDASLGARTLRRYDLATGETEAVSLNGSTVQEFVVVPRHADSTESDAWLIGLATDHEAGRTDLAVIAADDPTAGPVALVHLPVRVPDGFHGNWLADPMAI
jgi:carotenoid cleavage dioxygenase-like enzyme